MRHAHHERWDGGDTRRGWPVGYGVRRTPEAALGELEACAETQFDPRLVRLFVAEHHLYQDQLP